jgi:tetratricopeptide (TPR) repeat protein
MHNKDRDIQLWQQSIKAGNTCFEAQQNTMALRHYQQSIRLAESFFEYHHDPKAAVASLLISYQNLADLHLRLNDKPAAEQALQKAYLAISLSLNHASADSQRLDALLWGVGRAYVALAEYKKKLNTQGIANIPKPLKRPISNFN